jgi:hypothetical protein
VARSHSLAAASIRLLNPLVSVASMFALLAGAIACLQCQYRAVPLG